MRLNDYPKVKILPLSKLTFDARNANQGSPRGEAMLDSSLKRLGAGRSVLVDRQGRIIAGNKTVEQARKLGMKQIAVIETDGDTLLDLKQHRKAVELTQKYLELVRRFGRKE